MTKEQFSLLLSENNLMLSQNQFNQLDQYFHLLIEKNKVMNLTGITEEGEVYEKHFYDSLLFTFSAFFKKEGASLIDVGSGAGFPGLVIAICYPNLDVTLLEPLGKRCNFLNEVITALKLTNVNVVNMRSEDYAQTNREKYDFCVSRAVARLNILLELMMPLIKVGGIFIALKGDKGDEELLEAANALKKLSGTVIEKQEVTLPTNHDKRINIFVKKEKATANIYPRLYAKIKKKPL